MTLFQKFNIPHHESLHIEEYSLLYENYYLRADTTHEYVYLTKRLIHDKTFYAQGRIISEKLVKQFDKTKIRDKLIQLYSTLYDKRTQFSLTDLIENKRKKDYAII
jgi:hypothetical protein